jgi:hypothetical protein
MADTVIYAMYDDDDVTKDAAKKMVAKGIHIADVFSPFPIHGIDPIIGIKETRLGIVAFMFGITGLTLAMIAIRYMMIVDWHMNIGGKPNFDFLGNMPSFVPIMFEFTVLCAAHGMAFTYFLRNGTLPGMPSHNPDPRTTDDRFVVEIRPEENTQFTIEELSAFVKSTPIVEIEEKVIK